MEEETSPCHSDLNSRAAHVEDKIRGPRGGGTASQRCHGSSPTELASLTQLAHLSLRQRKQPAPKQLFEV
jgi:hypothetical protein